MSKRITSEPRETVLKQGEKTQQRIVAVSSRIFYEKGYHKATIHDIVEKTGLSKGNITYHFKTKEEILKAVIRYRIKEMKELFRRWSKERKQPEERISCFFNSLQEGRDYLAQYGCTNGSLAVELGKNDPLISKYNREIFRVQHRWFTEQFREMCSIDETEAEELTTELIIRCQGVCVVSQAYCDSTFFSREVAKIKAWLEDACSRKKALASDKKEKQEEASMMQG